MGVVQKGLRPIIPAECPAPLADIMRQCWAKNPRDRPSFDHLKTAMEELYQVGMLMQPWAQFQETCFLCPGVA